VNQFDEAWEVLPSGTEADFESLAARFANFPDGVDDRVSRRWIINAIDSGNILAVEWMISKSIELKFRDEEGYTVLHCCIDRGGGQKYEMIRALIAAGADINAKGINDWTPLHMAVWRDDLETIKILLEAGADTSILTIIDHYATAEEEAVMLGKNEAVALFRDHATKAR
jgi:uncharacterized protein